MFFRDVLSTVFYLWCSIHGMYGMIVLQSSTPLGCTHIEKYESFDFKVLMTPNVSANLKC
jgi:hypothetical protein